MAGQQTSNNELRIILLGKTGAGKSATGNTLANARPFKSSMQFRSETGECNVAETSYKGKDIAIIDTPGFMDTHLTEVELAKRVLRSLDFASPGPHVFGIVISPPRFTSEDSRVVKVIEFLFGPNFVDHAVIICTRGDDLEADGIQFPDLVKGAPDEIKKLYNDCKERAIVVNNRANKGRDLFYDSIRDWNCGETYHTDERGIMKDIDKYSTECGRITIEQKQANPINPDSDIPAVRGFFKKIFDAVKSFFSF